MIERIRYLVTRINALSVRERFLLFAATISVFGALTDVLFITPLLTQQKALVAQIDRKATDMDLLRERVNAEVMSRGVARAAEIAASLAQVQKEHSEIDLEIAELSSVSLAASASSTLLGKALRHTEKVALVRVVQIAPDPAPTAVASQPPAQPTPPVGPGALEITLAGNYLDIVDYLAAIEKSVPEARWAAIKLKADATPVQVTVRVVTGKWP